MALVLPQAPAARQGSVEIPLSDAEALPRELFPSRDGMWSRRAAVTVRLARGAPYRLGQLARGVSGTAFHCLGRTIR